MGAPLQRARPVSPPAAEDWSGLSGRNPFFLVGTIFGAKLATIVVVLAMEWSATAGMMVAATTWHWAIPIGALVAGPVAFALRLRRLRSRRDALRCAEWLGDAPPP